MKAIRLLILISSCMLQLACAGVQEKDPLSPSELNTNPGRYNRHNVLLRGYITLVPEGHNFYESEMLNAEFRHRVETDSMHFDPFTFEWKRYCLTIANPDLMYKHQSNFDKKTITVLGKFVDDYLGPRTLDLGACPLPTALYIDYANLRRRYPALFE